MHGILYFCALPSRQEKLPEQRHPPNYSWPNYQHCRETDSEEGAQGSAVSVKNAFLGGILGQKRNTEQKQIRCKQRVDFS